ncbi:zinc finger protein ZAT5 [Argentina anserina]|uniref:zinc finger protein ZAT5 n=1 Tax=Argentina anserina TaxID=57926 RepID=UPI002176888C|nr:zinc finger protein ZAT5 [Potentilla anserina]
MEGREVSDHQQSQMMIMKGKRTKRQRPQSPFGLAVTSSSSSACGGGEEYGNSFTSASYESTEEDEDMANCLILLAQGCDVVPKQQSSPVHEANTVSGHVSKAGFFVYECKTCNRTFPSFQALGGHRASHKKPKSAAAAMADQEKKLASTQFSSASMDQEVEESKQFVKKNSPPPLAHPTVSIQIKGMYPSHNNNKAKIHECSICGSEFTSGQALGGHMRRHRAVVANNNSTSGTTQVVGIGAAIDNSTRNKQERSILTLDLNLPAPEDHDHYHHHHHHLQQHQIHHQRDSKFQFVSTQQTSLVFNAPALVDCHY